MWCLGVRQHTCTSNQNTTSVSEGWHSFLKGSADVVQKVRRRRADWLFHILENKVVPYYQAQVAVKHLGMQLSAQLLCVHLLVHADSPTSLYNTWVHT